MGVTHRGSNIFLLLQTNRNLRNQSLLFLVVSHVLAPRHHLLESEQPIYKNLFMYWKNSQSSRIIFVGYFPINNFRIQSINFFFRSSSSIFFDFSKICSGNHHKKKKKNYSLDQYSIVQQVELNTVYLHFSPFF